MSKTRSTVQVKPEGTNKVRVEVIRDDGSKPQALVVTPAEAQAVFEVLAKVLGYEVG